MSKQAFSKISGDLCGRCKSDGKCFELDDGFARDEEHGIHPDGFVKDAFSDLYYPVNLVLRVRPERLDA